MKYTIEWVENKNNDWKVMTVRDVAGEIFTDCSVNRINKKGEVFPNFDAMTVGYEFEADIWTSDAGKRYLFAPRVKSEKSNYRTQQIEKNIDRKEGFIEKTINEKEEAIKTSSTFRDATNITLEMLKSEGGMTPDLFKEEWTKWRKWLLDNWTPQPF